jgi:DNA-binding NarL/FixJ family response regulator
MTNNETISLLIADELALVREGILRLCENAGGFANIHQCDNGAAALDVIRTSEPDVALVDFSIPKLFCLELIRRVKDEACPTRIVVMAAKGDRKTAIEVLRHGASGFVMKSACGGALVDAVRRVASGSLFIPPELELERVYLQPRRHEAVDRIETLSSREYQVFQLLVDGIRAKEIACRLNLSPKTVDTYRASLMRKLDIYDVAGLVKFAIQRDLTTT